MKILRVSILFLCLLSVVSCKNSTHKTPLDLFFNTPQVLEEKISNISKDSLAQVEGLLSNSSNLIV